MNPKTSETLAAALEATNRWFAEDRKRPDLTLQLVDKTTAKSIARDFEAMGGKHRKVKHWDWEDLYFRKVRYKDAWLYALVRRGRPRCLCYGRIEIKDRYVSLEYLERAPYARGIRGLATSTAFQFARTIAVLLDLPEVRINDPFPQLVRFYERTLGLVRHPLEGPVKYLYVRTS
jgi:hypothetical protein